VKEYMAKYGIDMVRGGAYSNCELDDEQIRLLEREILGASDKCYNCGRKGHFASDCRAAPASATSSSNCKRCGRSGHVEKNCYATKDIYGDEIDDGDSDGDECYRCGRDGHYARDCYAKRDIYGDEISDESDDDLQVRLQSHQMSLQNLSAKQTSGQCPAAPIVEVKLDKDIVHCYRCGCEGHYAHDCHATHHIYGDEIDD
jgi:cellular nucleic acid-binding protein